MLSDKSRTEAYRQVILNNSASLRNKAVMDLGCGTGIISLFCARLAQPSAVSPFSPPFHTPVYSHGEAECAGLNFVLHKVECAFTSICWMSVIFSVFVCLCLAVQVYAVEASSMAEYTRQLVRQNGCEDVITVLQGRAEEISLAEKVDVLVSEWMGNCLLVRITASVIAVGMNSFLHFVLSQRRLLLLSACQSEPPLGFLLLSDVPCGSSLSSWWSRCCWQETAG